MNDECIFCKIASGNVPSTKVYEDNDTIAFMDIGPVVKGHTLVVPKEHWDPLTETPDEVLQKLIVVVKRIARAQISGLRAEGVNVTQANGKVAGQIVPHVHIHVIPRFSQDGFQRRWTPGEYDSEEEMRGYADRIVQALE